MGTEQTNGLSVINGVQVWTDGNGITHFKPVDAGGKTEIIYIDDRPWWRKLYDWWKDAPVRPYAKIRDLADPFGDRRNDPDDYDAGSDGKTAGEIGIQIKF